MKMVKQLHSGFMGLNLSFYVKVGDDWTQSTKKRFVDSIKSTLKGPIQSAFLVDSCKLIKRKNCMVLMMENYINL